MRFASAILLSGMLAVPTLAAAQDSTNLPSTTPNTDCSVSGGCTSTGTGSLPNTTPDSTLEGGASGGGSGSNGGPLENTSPGSTSNPGDSSGSGGSGGLGSGGSGSDGSGSGGSGSGGAAGPLNNTTPQ